MTNATPMSTPATTTTTLKLVARVEAQGEEFKAEIISGLPRTQQMLAYGNSPEAARAALLTRLRNSPVRGTIRFEAYEDATSVLRTENLATERQVAYIMSLCEQIAPMTEEQRTSLRKQYEGMTRKEVSQQIDGLKIAKAELQRMGKLPAPLNPNVQPQARPTEQVAPKPKATEGFYRLDGDIIKVVRAVYGSGHLYAKVLTDKGNGKFSFVHRKGVMARLTPEHALTEAEASEFGKLYGVCCICGRTLTDEHSIARGIGPVCADKMGW